jgi:orotate phosphoribosyltransferase
LTEALTGSASVQERDKSVRDPLEELRTLLQERSIRKGSFTLASGDHSNYYCDTKAVTLSPQGSELVGQVLFPLVEKLDAEAVGGLAMGALFVSAPIVHASESHHRPLYGFAVRQQQKEHGLQESIEESYHPSGESLLKEGRRVVVVDDVITKGGSVLKAIKAVQAKGCKIVGVIALVDRQAGGEKRLHEVGLCYYPLFYTDDSGTLHVDERTSALARTPPRGDQAPAWRHESSRPKPSL